MTEFIFRENPNLFEMQAKVTSIENNKITVDKTIFFSFSGGQQSDSGTIGGINVVDSSKVGEEIYYTLEEAPNFKVGDCVEIKIDREKREKITKLHSAVHIVGDFFEKKYKIPINEILGSNVEVTKGRLDYMYPENISSILEELELEVNNFLSESHEVKHYQKEGDKWEWQCGDFICPCGGTHVRNTKDIGKIRLKRKNNGSGKERIEIYLD